MFILVFIVVKLSFLKFSDVYIFRCEYERLVYVFRGERF